MDQVNQFHNLAHVFISLLGAILLLAIYFNIKKRFSQLLEEEETEKRVDKGLLYLSLAVFIWVLSGVWAILANYFGMTNEFVDQLLISNFSILNNLFILLALFYFHYAPSFIYQNDKNIKTIIWIIILVATSTLVISRLSSLEVYNGIKLLAIPDFLLSGFLSYLLLISLYKTFLHRGLKLVSIISSIVVLVIFTSQLPEVFTSLDDSFNNQLIKLISKTSLIFIFLVLATTWVIRLANTPRIYEIELKFIDWSLIQLSIPSKGIRKQHIDFGSKTTQFKNLLKLAVRRKYGEGDEQSILVGASGEIKNQSYLSRVIDNVNELLSDDNQKLDRKDLFTFLGEGRYRLRMLPEHISFDGALLSEFKQASENSSYSQLLKS